MKVSILFLFASCNMLYTLHISWIFESFCINASLHETYAILVCNLKFTIYTVTFFFVLFIKFNGDFCMGTLFSIYALHLRKTDESTLSIHFSSIVT